ncbi:MAG: hydrogenase maturation protein HypF [Solirubrobacteraceae bacterium]|nr:hydrogenase maturation protein HypF [Solirubrobacteraceae bacterium]
MTARARGRIEGVVQGVGFRPHAYRLAAELGLGGFVLNDERGVEIEIEGDSGAIAAFRERLKSEAPPLAVIERTTWEDVAPDDGGAPRFTILPSRGAGEARAPIAADAPTCARCLAEVLDPGDRRYRYPFANCTDCGPRFTIVRGVPYDRSRTTMAGFAMCDDCRAEYENPSDRRYHAQPIACPACGPRARIVGVECDDAVAWAAAALRGGAVVAVKGLGGYHLACRADDEAACARLRSRKHREDKPFAIMVRDVETARELVFLDDDAPLTSPARPIVVARRRPGAPVAPSVAPASPDLGVMLPYTPLHHLLLADAGVPLVMTSGNVSDEPIAFEDDDALERLSGIADHLLAHDRPIETRVDDSVVRGPLIIRRSRGIVPAALPLGDAPPLLAVGAEQKHTFCLAKGGRAWLSHHIGDLENWETLSSFVTGVAHFEDVFDIAPELVVHDLHPGYLSTTHALELDGVALLGVQHHHAHLAAVLGEHGVGGPVAGAIYDGTGYGTDGTIWGGELLVGDARAYERAGHLLGVRMPGGAAAVREPWRMALAWLTAAGEDRPPTLDEDPRWEAVASVARSEISPVTTSMGRLFDAAAALCGLRNACTYEGQAAVELEAAATGVAAAPYPIDLSDDLVLDPRPAIAALARDARAGARVEDMAAAFHAGVADATARAILATGIGTAVLSGGVFQNRLLLEAVTDQLQAAGVAVLVPRLVPPNDGGIAYGQAVVAAAT